MRQGGVLVTKIIHVISDSNIGGAGKYLLTYLENCNTDEFDIKIVLPKNSMLIQEIEKLGFSYIEIDYLAEKTFDVKAVGKLKSVFKTEKPDVVHAHACLSARIAAKISKVKAIIYTRHTDAARSRLLTNPIGKLANKIINGFFADGIIAVSEVAKKNLLDTGISEKKIRVIYNGVNPVKKADENQKIKIYESFNLDINKKVIAIVARLEEIKGHKYFIDAAKIVQDNGYDAVFVIAGVGSLEYDLKKYVKENYVNNVVFLGFVDNVYDLNNIMYLQINASLYEAVGLSILEGMRLGVPAIVSSYGGNPELTKNGINGYVVNGQNSEEFAEKIMLLLNDSVLYNELSKNAISVFNENFTASNMTRKTEEYYKYVLEGKI